MTQPLQIFIGWDSREPEAAAVCAHSIVKHASIAVDIHFLQQQDLRDRGLYTRDHDERASTEFSLTRFLVPYLANYQSWALFVDCDFLFEHDVAELFQIRDPRYAVQVVKHDYAPTDSTKMDGKTQYAYPRKNWSSLMLFNCGHDNTQSLTLDYVNSASPSELHQFAWCHDDEIGAVSHEWNWLVGWYHAPKDGHPRAIHYTQGGPWFPEYLGCEYGANWILARNEVYPPPLPPVPRHTLDMVTPEIAHIFQDILKYRVDPGADYYDINIEDLVRRVIQLDNNTVAAIDMEPGETKYKEKGKMYDPILQSFVQGAGGRISTWSREENSVIPVVLRGVTKRKEMRACREQGRDFYYIDTGYFGNGRKKTYHRVTLNDVQNFGPIIDRPRDRLAATQVQLTKFRGGRSILLAPPSQKLLNLYDINLEDWLAQTQATLRLHTDRPIVVRTKQGRSVRVTTDTMEMALAQDVHCLVTFSSIAAVEALLLGKPVITLGPNAAAPLCSHRLDEIENPRVPTLDEVEALMAHLAYCQFTEPEMRDGTAWKILRGD